MTSIPPVKVDIVAGQNTAIPELQRTGTEILRVAAGATGGHDPVQKFSRALILGEAREGSLVLRAMRTEITGLGAEALGVQGPLGHLAVTLAEFGVGGATGLLAVTGFAAIGLEVKTLLGLTDALEKALLKANIQFAQMGGSVAAARARIADLKSQRETTEAETSSPGFLERIKIVATGGAAADTYVQQKRSETATLSNEVARQEIELEHEKLKAIEARQQQERAWEKTLGDSQNAVEKLRLGLHPTNVALADLEHASKLLAIGLSGLEPAQQQRLFLLENERAAIERVNAATRDRQARDDQQRKDEAVFPTMPTQGDIYDWARLGLGGNVSPLDKLTPAGTTPMENTVRGASEKAAGKYDPGESPAPKPDKLDIRRIASEAAAEIAALRSGDAGAALTGTGSLLTTLGADKAHGGLGLEGLPGIGTAFSIFGTAVSLFNNSAERRHREQIAVLKKIAEKAVPEGRVVQPIYVGADAKTAGQVDYEVGRFQDRDGVYRGVGQP